MVSELTDGVRAAEFCRQDGYAYRFDWGPEGLAALAPHCEVVVIVDVLRFTSAVCCAVESGATVLPYRWKDDTAGAFAAAHGAALAGLREHGEASLSPTDLLTLRKGVRLVLPSPNGSTLALTAAEQGVPHVLAGCLRNATATSVSARRLAAGGPIGIIAAGERWGDPAGPLRPAVEDLLGAGAVLWALDPSASISRPACSPEAAAARAAFLAARPRLYEVLLDCSSGRELVGRGWEDDVATSAAHDVTPFACRLDEGEFSLAR
ncbi:MAG: 2-phosphosulfolactate phosphatase [Ilumatobacteraceae bacterium]|nr:2-phosphosulfolactate phosphatase [Ilumatobacteraceae bacterium]